MPRQPPAFGRFIGASHEIGGRGPCFHLGDRDGGLLPFEHHPGEIPALLRFGAVRTQRADDAEVALDDDTRGHAAGARDFLDHEDDVEDGRVPAPVLARDRHPHE